MKINMIPTTLVLSVMSWLVAIFGLGISGYILISQGNELRPLLFSLAVLFVSLFLAAIARMFGIIGQVLFDLRVYIQSLSKAVSQESKETHNILTKGFSNLNQGLKAQLQEQAASLIKAGEDQAIILIKALQELNKAVSQESKETHNILTKGFSNLNQDLKAQLQEQAASLIKAGEDQAIILIKTLQELNKNLTINSGESKKSMEQINLNASNINQNIDKIKSFFGQIERHLDLKK